MAPLTPAGCCPDSGRSLCFTSSTFRPFRLQPPHAPRHRFDTLPFSVTGFHANRLPTTRCRQPHRTWSGLRQYLAGSPRHTAESSSLALRTGPSPPGTPHPASRRRSSVRLQAGNECLKRTLTFLIKLTCRRTRWPTWPTWPKTEGGQQSHHRSVPSHPKSTVTARNSTARAPARPLSPTRRDRPPGRLKRDDRTNPNRARRPNPRLNRNPPPQTGATFPPVYYSRTRRPKSIFHNHPLEQGRAPRKETQPTANSREIKLRKSNRPLSGDSLHDNSPQQNRYPPITRPLKAP
jgi:hypothetical protein